MIDSDALQIIQQVTKDSSATEQQGTKAKFWFGENKDQLCKFGKVHGENWAELVANALAISLNIPCAKYNAAEFHNENKSVTRCVVSTLFIDRSSGERLINANELLAKYVPNYDQSKTYKQQKYTFARAAILVNALECKGLNSYSPIQQFIGYLLFDVFIANQDRHHENWGFVSSSSPLYLAPTFDHGSSMACRISDEERVRRLRSTDKGYQINHFVTSAKSAMYGVNNKLLKLHELARQCKKQYPAESLFWMKKIANIPESEIKQIVSNTCPSGWLTDIEKEFTLKLLLANQAFLKGL